MTIPFLDFFKKLTGRSATETTEPETGGATAVTTAPARLSKKPASERLSKTVLPNATRSFSPPDPFRSAASAVASRTNAPTMQLGSQRITAAPKKVQGSNLPPALARALEPKLERAISLRIADFIDCVPAGYIKPVEILDPSARVSLKASEIEKGMPEKSPSIALPSLYQQVPEIFLKGVRPDDDTRVALPYDKVLEQFRGAQVRPDQMRDAAVPQLDTPILKATIQDSERFGTKIEPIEASTLPSVPVNPATAEAIAAAEPDAFVQTTAKSKTASGHPVISLYSSDIKPKSEPPTPKAPSKSGPSRTGTTIPFDLSPNGTGGSASERVPASGGPPVPTPLPFTPELAKVAFPPAAKPSTPSVAKAPETTAPKAEQKPSIPLAKQPLKLTEEFSAKLEPKVSLTPAKVALTPVKDERTIKLSVKAVFKNLPAFQLQGDIAAVADDAQVELPLALVEPQLACGRISITPDVFQKALPEKYRQMFQTDEVKTPVNLPLEEVLKNLPATVLKLRDDQEHFSLDKDFETPFSVKAKEDAERFAPAKAPKEEPAEKPAEQPVAETKVEAAPAPKKLEPKEVVSEVNALPGVKACAITFSDGLSLAGELPVETGAEGLCAVAPSLLKRMEQHVRDTKLGALVAVTLYASGSSVSFFSRGNICLTAVHAEGSLAAETRARIGELVEKLSSTYAQPEK